MPIAKMIQHDRYKYAAFDKFPLGIKVFINSVVVFVDAVSVYKQYGLIIPHTRRHHWCASHHLLAVTGVAATSS